MKVFYSWQTDTPTNIGKAFIRQALDDAVSQLADAMELDEAERPSIDQDTQGVMGSPPIAETIFEKIRNSDVVVVDVTLVGSTPQLKPLINSNVAYELGYAHGHHGDHILLAVMNTHYGSPEDLPFDLKHRRWPVRFQLSPDANPTERREARHNLASEFAKILGQYYRNRSPQKQHEKIPSTVNPATYWREGETLVHRTSQQPSDDTAQLSYANGQALSYLRIWPDAPLDHLTGRDLSNYEVTSIEPLLGRSGAYSHDRNQYGAITYAGDNEAGINSSTQVFRNREIWGVDALILRDKDGYKSKSVPTRAFEQGMLRSLKNYLRVAYEHLGYRGTIHVEAGMVNVTGYRLAMRIDSWEQFWGPIYEDVSVVTSVSHDDPASADAALLAIFEAVFDAAGSQRPEHLYGFPPKQG